MEDIGKSEPDFTLQTFETKHLQLIALSQKNSAEIILINCSWVYISTQDQQWYKCNYFVCASLNVVKLKLFCHMYVAKVS